MEEIHLTFPTAIIFTIFVLLLAILYRIFYASSTNKNRSAPQAHGALPIIGHLHLLDGLIHRKLGEMADKYGPIFRIKLGVHHALVVSDSEMAKEFLTTHDKCFASRPKMLAAEVMGYGEALLGLAPYGEYWRQMRKITVLELLSLRRLEMLKHIRISEVTLSINDIFERYMTNRSSRDYSNMMKIEMKQFFGSITLNIIVKILTGKRHSNGNKDGDRFKQAIKEFVRLFGVFVVSDTIPSLRWLDLGGHEKAMNVIAKEIDEILEIWLQEHKKKRMYEKQIKGEEGDFIDVLLSLLEGESSDALVGTNVDTAIKSTCLAILSAASDTTPITLTWALSLLLNNPQVMENARNELDINVGRERRVEEADMRKLVYLDAIIKETLRLYPPAPFSVPHESTDDCIVAGYHIPKGTRLLMNIWKIHHDPNNWSDPYEFRPERFLTSHEDIDFKGQHFEYIPFGSGRRMCPGISFAHQVLQLTLASLIQGFEIENPSREPIDMTESSGFTTHKEAPLDVLMIPRLPHNLYS